MADRLSNSLNDAIAGLQMVDFTTTVTIPDGRSTPQIIEVDFSSVVPLGKTLIGNSIVRLNSYTLPYRNADGSYSTWVNSIDGSTKKIQIQSTATEWTNYTLRVILFFK